MQSEGPELRDSRTDNKRMGWEPGGSHPILGFAARALLPCTATFGPLRVCAVALLNKRFAGMPAMEHSREAILKPLRLPPSGRSAVVRRLLAPSGFQERDRLVVLVHGNLRFLDWV